MDLEEGIKYLIWIVFFCIALAAIYTLLKRLGVL